MERAISLFVLLCASIAAFGVGAPDSKLQGLDKLAESLREQWNVPGVAVGIVQDGKVIFAKGYGYRNLEQKLPATTKTLFPIGSVSKSFTALSIAILNDQGKVQWDEHVRHYLPTFQLKNPYATDHMTLRDLLTHRSGLARHDLLWYSSSFSRKQLFDRLQYLDMSHEFRSGYEYNNLTVMTAGYLAGEVSGLGWEGLVRQRIFDPLEMKLSNFDNAESQKSDDYALPYAEVKGAIKLIPFKSAQAIGPAGGINSNVDEMLHYVIMLLSKGKYGNTQVVSEAGLRQIQSPQTVMGATPQFPEFGFPAYAMGWVAQSYRGHPYVWHNGGIDGFYSLVALLPNDNIGLVILTNRLGHSASEVLAYNIFDRLLGLDQIAWGERFKASEGKAAQAEAEDIKQIWAERKPGTHPSRDLKDYAGKYENPGYGNVTIALANGTLSFTLNDLSAAPLQHYHYDTFITPEDNENLSLLKMRFNTAMNGNVESVSIPLEAGIPDIVFTRVVEKQNNPQPAGK
jgi:CubicO group peptidase (beta-lactamase class C family)